MRQGVWSCLLLRVLAERCWGQRASSCGVRDVRVRRFRAQDVSKTMLGQDGDKRWTDILAGKEGMLRFTELKFGDT